jgi:hypothetical protein
VTGATANCGRAARFAGQGQRPQHIELVTIRVGHDHPADLALTDGDALGAQCLQPGDLGYLISGPKIQMQPVLDDLMLRDPHEDQVGNDAILGAALRRLKDDLIFLLKRTPPAKRGLPERGDPAGVTCIDTQALNTYIHAPTLTSSSCSVQ